MTNLGDWYLLNVGSTDDKEMVNFVLIFVLGGLTTMT